jgi:hypothetical protein
MQSNQTSSRKNPSPLEARLPGPRFPAGLCPLLCAVVLIGYVLINGSKIPSADKLRAKSGKTMVGGAAAGAYNICEAWL